MEKDFREKFLELDGALAFGKNLVEAMRGDGCTMIPISTCERQIGLYEEMVDLLKAKLTEKGVEV